MPLISLAIRIGADPNVTTVQFCGNAARDVQIVQREFFTQRGVDAAQERVGPGIW